MRPIISATSFGTITIDGIEYSHDVYLTAEGRISKRKKKLSKRRYGTSHMLSEDELEFVLDDKAERLLIGTGQYGRVRLSESAIGLLAIRNVVAELYPTPQAIQIWNENDEFRHGIFHVTC